MARLSLLSHRERRLLLAFLAVALAGCSTGGEEPVVIDADAHRAEVERWRAERFAKLTAADGWLTLAGLHWLEEGAARVGSAPDSDIVLPPTAPAAVGELRRAGRDVRLVLEPGVSARIDGAPAAGEVALRSDAEGEPTKVELGDVSFLVIARGDRLALRVRDAASESRRNPPRLEYYPVNPSWRVEARLEPYEPAKTIRVADYTGGIQEEVVPGALVFDAAGGSYRLDAFDAGEELFVIFGDPTNGVETYGAGRYLYTRKPGADGIVVVDFNKAYSPPCAFTTFATCPLPPPQNRLPIRVEAGEKSEPHD